MSTHLRTTYKKTTSFLSFVNIFNVDEKRNKLNTQLLLYNFFRKRKMNESILLSETRTSVYT